ncbi:MAG TPA: alpha/beta hydrolase [Acidimicrobiia bacterium]
MRRATTSPVAAACCVAAACVLVAATAGPAGAGTSARSADAPGATALVWMPCGGGFECTTLRVPVDYADGGGETLPMAVTRRVADDPARRIGSLVLNFGGPGDPGTSTLRSAVRTIPPDIRSRFDLVSFDPRGSGRSRPVDCIDDATFARAWADDRTPDTAADLPRFYDGTAFSVDLVGDCVSRFGTWLAHLGTRNVARDLEQLRAALGEPKLTFLGYSYGTVIGAVYAQAFPDHVRALVLDSAVDLSSSMAVQLRANAAGFERALKEFVDDCRAHDGCAFRPGVDPGRALDDLRVRLESGARIDTADGRTVGSTELYVALLAALYSPDVWPFLAESLQQATADGDATGLEVLSDSYAGRRGDGTYSNYQEVLGVIVCDDQPEPLVSFESFRASYASFARDYPFFGPLLAGSPLGCDPRLPPPRADEVVGDVRTNRAPPILVIGTTRDPATPYRGAVDLRRRLGGSRLLTVDDTRHGTYATGNLCVDRIVDRYLVTRRVPRVGARCSAA